MKKIASVIVVSLLSTSPLLAQKLFLTGDVGYGVSSDVDITNDSNQKGKLKASGGVMGGLGIGANYGKYDIIGGWQYNQINFDKFVENNDEIKLKDSGITRHDITIGGRVRPMDGALQPYLSGKLGMGFWSAKTDNEAQTGFPANSFKSSESGIKFVYGLGVGLDYQATEKVSFGAFYNFSSAVGDYSVKFAVDNSKAKIDSAGTHYFGAGVKIKF